MLSTCCNRATSYWSPLSDTSPRCMGVHLAEVEELSSPNAAACSKARGSGKLPIPEDDAVYCPDCEMWLNGPAQWEDHKVRQRHKKKERRQKILQIKREERDPEPTQATADGPASGTTRVSFAQQDEIIEMPGLSRSIPKSGASHKATVARLEFGEYDRP